MAKRKKTLRTTSASNRIYYCEMETNDTMALEGRIDMTSDAVLAVGHHLNNVQNTMFDGKVGKGLKLGFPDETKMMTLIPESKWEEVKKNCMGR